MFQCSERHVAKTVWQILCDEIMHSSGNWSPITNLGPLALCIQTPNRTTFFRRLATCNVSMSNDTFTRGHYLESTSSVDCITARNFNKSCFFTPSHWNWNTCTWSWCWHPWWWNCRWRQWWKRSNLWHLQIVRWRDVNTAPFPWTHRCHLPHQFSFLLLLVVHLDADS